MEKKLTLRMEEQFISNAKHYARKNHTSLSKLVEQFFKYISSNDKDSDDKKTPVVKELSGIIELPDNFEYKTAKTQCLIEKYLK